MKSLNSIGLIALVVTMFAAGFFASRSCSVEPCPELVSSDTTAVDKTITDDIKGDEIETVEKEIEVPVYITGEIDTNAIIERYLSKTNYQSTYKDSMVSITIDHSVLKGKGSISNIKYSLKYKELQVTNVWADQKNNLWLFGVNANLSRSKEKIGFGPAISLLRKQKTLIGVNYNLLDPEFNLGISALWRIGR